MAIELPSPYITRSLQTTTEKSSPIIFNFQVSIARVLCTVVVYIIRIEIAIILNTHDWNAKNITWKNIAHRHVEVNRTVASSMPIFDVY